MPTDRKLIPPDILLESYRRHAGNKSEVAKELGCHRSTVRKCLELYGVADKPVVSGSNKPLKHNVMTLPEQGKIKRYLLTCAQNNTRVFIPFWNNLLAYKAWLGDCELMVSRFTYNKNQYLNPKSQKPGMVNASDEDDCWYDGLILPYVCDDPDRHGTRLWQLAPDFSWCAEMNIGPTATKPLSDLKTYTGTASCAFPHVKVRMESVPVLQGQDPKFIYTTGTVTGRNYIQKKAGIKAEFHHTNAVLLVEVDHEGNWWARQIVCDRKGAFYDCPEGQPVKVAEGEVTTGHRAEAINWGDVHVTDMPEERKHRYWGKDSVIEVLNPKYQFFHDTLSFRSRSHHEMSSFSKMIEKYYRGVDSVEDELRKTVDFLSFSERSGTLSVVVKSNHDDHGDVWLDRADYKSDYPNAEVFLESQLARVKAIKLAAREGIRCQWTFLGWANRRFNGPETVRFLLSGEKFTICAKSGHPIECSLHGDKGPNGSRGSTANLSTLGCKITKGHDHSATIIDGVYSAGTCAMEQGYNENGGPTTWSVSHIITWPNGKRCIVSERNLTLWAEAA
jgi:hypothetical protein